jgi:hypothetical protein
MTMVETPFSKLFPDLPQGVNSPFWYSSLQSLWLYYRVEPDVLRERLPDLPGGQHLEIALFDFGDGQKSGLASLDLQRYLSGGADWLEATQEVEFNFYVYPVARMPEVPELHWRQYLMGFDQTKSIGGLRLHVPCDDPQAIQAGIGLFGEPKFLAHFATQVPSLNSPDVTTWSYDVYQDVKGQQGPLMWGIDANFNGLDAVPANPSPLIEYGILVQEGVRLLVANFWSFYGPFETYWLDDLDPPDRVSLKLGEPDPSGTVQDIELLLGPSQPIAAQIFQSPPVSSESRGWYQVPKGT